AGLGPIDAKQSMWSLRAAVQPGDRPAVGAAREIHASQARSVWTYGTRGPVITLPHAGTPTDAFARIDAGLHTGSWELLVMGCFFGFPPGFTLTSQVGDDDAFVELQLDENGRPVQDAFIRLEQRPIAAEHVKLRGKERTVATDVGAVRT